jgi:hypothetical protein
MAKTSALQISGDIGGASMNSTYNLSADGAISHDPPVPAGKTGTLSTRSA